jgi:hypothetical protein
MPTALSILQRLHERRGCANEKNRREKERSAVSQPARGPQAFGNALLSANRRDCVEPDGLCATSCDSAAESDTTKQFLPTVRPVAAMARHSMLRVLAAVPFRSQ